MKKNLIIFTLFLILAVTYFLQETRRPERNESAGYHPVLSGGFKPSQVTSISFYPPGKKDKAVLITRDESREGEWRVTSRFNAPAEKSRVKKLLKQIETMEGEERADDPSLLANFSLEEEKSYHLVLSGKKGELYHLLIGKRSDTFTYGFLRMKGENRVFLADKEFRYEFGINSDGVESSPDQVKWLNKRIISLKREELKRVSYEGKEGKIVFEKKIEEVGSDDRKEGPHEQPAEAWALVDDSGTSRKDVSWESIRPLVASLASLGASDIVDPARKKESGLEKPQAAVTLVTKDGRSERVYLGSRKEGEDEKFYVMKEGVDLVYEIYPSTREGAFDRFKEVADKVK